MDSPLSTPGFCCVASLIYTWVGLCHLDGFPLVYLPVPLLITTMPYLLRFIRKSWFSYSRAPTL